MPPIKQLPKHYLGIDPGTNGGIAHLVRAAGKRYLTCYAMPPDPLGLSNLLKELSYPHPLVYLEKVWAFAGQQAKSSFTFGQNFGAIQALLAAYKLSYVEVTPQAWQKKFKFLPAKPPKRPNGESDKTAWKKRLRDSAMKLYPEAVWTADELPLWEQNQKAQLAVADAICIAHVCMEDDR